MDTDHQSSSLLRRVLGCGLWMEMWFMLTINVLVASAIIRGRLTLASNANRCLYMISLFNICSESVQLLLHVTYVGPTYFFGSFIFHDAYSVGVTVAATIFLGVWYLGSFIQILMSVNRLLVVSYPHVVLFTRRSIAVILIACCLTCAALVTYSQLLSPCCRIIPDWRFFGYSYLTFGNVTENTSAMFVDLPLDTGTSVICAVSYIMMFRYIGKMRKTSQSERIYRKQLRFCLQYLIVYLTYTVTWATFFLYPQIGITTHEAYCVTTVVFMLNCGVNSIIYMSLNSDVRYQLAEMLSSTPVGRVFKHNSPNRITTQTHSHFRIQTVSR